MKRLKAADVYKEVKYTRNQLRGLLDELGYKFESDTETQPRVARTYSPQDFLVILIACELESNQGFRRGMIASLMPHIASELSGPRLPGKQPKLILTMNPASAKYVDGQSNVDYGLVLPLSEIFARVDFCLHEVEGALVSSQATLNFGPSLVRGEKNMSTENVKSQLRTKR